MQYEIQALNERVERESQFVPLLQKSIQRVIIGQRYLVDRLLIGILCDGHVLIEGVPGLAKTLSVKTLAASVDTTFRRIQFTPDLLPADLVGTEVYNPRDHTFTPKKGPLFANFILADEINRAPAKVQSALLECMQERQVTIGDKTYALEFPFLVLATQNPIEQEGTYPLPEAQVDRFMLKAVINYPKIDEEQLIIRQNMSIAHKVVNPVVNKEDVLRARNTVREIYMDEKIERYILNIVFATRKPEDYKLEKLKPLISYGGSPRASINLALAAKAHAFMKRRGYVIPEDIRSICFDVMRHRVGLTYEAEAENVTSENILSEILNAVEVP